MRFGNKTTVAGLEPGAGKSGPKQDSMHTAEETASEMSNPNDVILPRRGEETTHGKELWSKMNTDEPVKGRDDSREHGQAGAATCGGVPTIKELEGARRRRWEWYPNKEGRRDDGNTTTG
jgi:hypothetical protein